MFISITTVLTIQLIFCSELYTPAVHLPHPSVHEVLHPATKVKKHFNTNINNV